MSPEDVVGSQALNPWPPLRPEPTPRPSNSDSGVLRTFRRGPASEFVANRIETCLVRAATGDGGSADTCSVSVADVPQCEASRTWAAPSFQVHDACSPFLGTGVPSHPCSACRHANPRHPSTCGRRARAGRAGGPGAYSRNQEQGPARSSRRGFRSGVFKCPQTIHVETGLRRLWRCTRSCRRCQKVG
jgi:hypothetical protein